MTFTKNIQTLDPNTWEIVTRHLQLLSKQMDEQALNQVSYLVKFAFSMGYMDVQIE